MHIHVRKIFSFLYLTAGNSIAKSETTVFPEGNRPKRQSGGLVSENYMKFGGHYYRKAYSNSVPYELIKYFDCQFAVENGHAFYYSVIIFPVRNVSS